MHSDRTNPPTLFTPSRLRGPLSFVLGAALLSACIDDEPNAGASDDALAEELPEPPQLTPEELAALRAEVTLASLPVQPAGVVEIVDTGAPGAPALTYVATGGRTATDVLRQLVAEQGASPAEVFLALADADATLPERLVADHRARAERDPNLSILPRRLSYTTPRTLQTLANECLGAGGDPISFSNWVDDWEDRFESINFSAAFADSDRNQAGGATSYYVGADADGRVLSACNADNNNDASVSYWKLTMIPGSLYYPYSYVWSGTLNSFKAVHLYSTGGDQLYRMSVNHTHPDPDTYVAFGRCGFGCP